MEDVRPSLNIRFLLLDRFTLSALSTFLDPLRLAADTGDNSGQVRIRWDLTTIDDRAVVSSCGIEIHPSTKSRHGDDPDYLVIVGGLISSRHHRDSRVVDELKRANERRTPIVGLCTGVFPMIAAGLLDGEKCCVNWFHYEDLVERFYEVEPDSSVLYHFDGRYGTCAGGIGASCLSLQLIERHFGKRLADKAAWILMVPDELRIRPVQPVECDMNHVTDIVVRRALLLLGQHLSESFPIEYVALQVGVSMRHLERRFKKALGKTPSSMLRVMRMRRARKLLETTDLKVIEIAMACGYDSPSQFSVMFRRVWGQSPIGIRKSHAQTKRRDDVSQAAPLQVENEAGLLH